MGEVKNPTTQKLELWLTQMPEELVHAKRVCSLFYLSCRVSIGDFFCLCVCCYQKPLILHSLFSKKPRVPKFKVSAFNFQKLKCSLGIFRKSQEASVHNFDHKGTNDAIFHKGGRCAPPPSTGAIIRLTICQENK